MTKILTATQIRDLDKYTIKHEPIKSLDLMERASEAFVAWFISRYEKQTNLEIFCGTGNNGGDGFAIARLLTAKGYRSNVYLIGNQSKMTSDCKSNYDRLKGQINVIITDDSESLSLNKNAVIIDAIFGTGLSRNVEGIYTQVIDKIKGSGGEVVAVDIPSGLFCDSPQSEGAVVRATQTVSFQIPKLSFMMPETGKYVGKWHIVNIGLDAKELDKLESPFYTLDKSFIASMIRKRKKFSHKGTYGRALMMVGSHGKMGAAVLAARAALRSGLGLLTTHIPACGYEIMQTSIPEAMVLTDQSAHHITEAIEVGAYNVIGVGPGIGTEPETQLALKKILEKSEYPMVIDADALNIIGEKRELLHLIPEGSILTPHLKEFERFAGESKNDFDRLELQRAISKLYKIIIILKGAHSAISIADGRVYFNTTGNPGMATAGSGDVLTGILTGLLAQGYSSENAACLGVYLHGLAGDFARDKVGVEALIAGDIIENLGKAYLSL